MPMSSVLLMVLAAALGGIVVLWSTRRNQKVAESAKKRPRKKQRKKLPQFERADSETVARCKIPGFSRDIDRDNAGNRRIKNAV